MWQPASSSCAGRSSATLAPGSPGLPCYLPFSLVPGARQRLRHVGGRQEPPLGLRGLAERVRIGVHHLLGRLLGGARRQQRDLVHHVLHLVAQGRLRRRREQRTHLGAATAAGVEVCFAFAVLLQFQEGLVALAAAGLAFVARLYYSEGPAVLLVTAVALALVRQ